jgi:hypothetical protein
MARNVTLTRGSSYKNGGQQKTDTFLAFKLNEGVKLENVFDTLIGVNPSMEYVEHDGNGAIIGWSLKEAYYSETTRAGIVLTAGNKETYFEKNFRGNNSTTGGQFIPTNLKGQANGVAELDANGNVPLSQLEIVEYDLAIGTVTTKDSNSETESVAHWSNLVNKSTLVDNDRFYIADPAITNGQNKLASFGDIKTQLKTDLLTGVVIKNSLTNKIPLTDLEIVSYVGTSGVVETKDGNSTSVLSVADASQLTVETVNKPTDLFYFNDPLTATNKKITFADLKKELSGECKKLGTLTITKDVPTKFPNTFGTADLASVTVYDSFGNIITNETNLTTNVTATDVTVTCSFTIPNAYVIACTPFGASTGGTGTPTTTTNVISNTGYKVKTTVNGVVSNEIELPCPIVGQIDLPDILRKKVDFSVGQFGFQLGNNNPRFDLVLPTIPTAPVGYGYYIDLKFICAVNDRTQVYPNSKSRILLRTLSPSNDEFSDINYDNQVSVNQETRATINVLGAKLDTGTNTITTIVSYEVSAQQTTPSDDRCNFRLPKYFYKIYLAKTTF